MYTEQNNINLLFFRHQPSSLSEVKSLLDNNCYAGRNNPVIARKNGTATNCIKIEIILLPSGFKYTWPLENSYNLRTHKFEDTKIKPKVHVSFEQVLRFHINKAYLFKPNMTVSQLISYTLNNVAHSFKIAGDLVHQMVKFGLLDAQNMFVLKTYDEISEICANLFDMEMYNYFK